MSGHQSFASKTGLPPVLVRYWLWTLALTALSLAYTETMIHVFHSSSTLGPRVLWNDDRWWDFLVFQERFQHFRSAAFWDAFDYPFTYPAAMALVFEALYKVPHVVREYLLTLLAAVVVGVFATARSMAARGSSLAFALAFALTIPATAWPLWLLLGSANTEGLVALLLAGGLFAVMRRWWWTAAVLIAVAGSLKIFPLALLALLLTKRRYKEFAGALLLTAALTAGSLVVLGPSIAVAQQHIGEGFHFVKQTYALNSTPQSLDVNHSLFSPVKFAVVLLHRGINAGPALSAAFDIYTLAASVFGAGLYFLFMRKLPFLNQMLALDVCAVLLPPYSVDYTLVHLFVPCGLLCVYATDAWQRRSEVPGLGLCFACFALMFTIGTFFTARFRFGSQVRMVALVVLLVAVLRNPFPWAALDVDAAEGVSR